MMKRAGVRYTRSFRWKVMSDVIEKVERHVPDRVILQYIVNNTPYSLRSAYDFILEAKMRADYLKEMEWTR